jgi:hypothetical protein
MLIRAADDFLQQADEMRHGHAVIKAELPKPDWTPRVI